MVGFGEFRGGAIGGSPRNRGTHRVSARSALSHWDVFAYVVFHARPFRARRRPHFRVTPRSALREREISRDDAWRMSPPGLVVALGFGAAFDSKQHSARHQCCRWPAKFYRQHLARVMQSRPAANQQSAAASNQARCGMTTPRPRAAKRAPHATRSTSPGSLPPHATPRRRAAPSSPWAPTAQHLPRQGAAIRDEFGRRYETAAR